MCHKAIVNHVLPVTIRYTLQIEQPQNWIESTIVKIAQEGSEDERASMMIPCLQFDHVNISFNLEHINAPKDEKTPRDLANSITRHLSSSKTRFCLRWLINSS